MDLDDMDNFIECEDEERRRDICYSTRMSELCLRKVE